MARLRGRAYAARGREREDLLAALTANLYAHEHDFTEDELRAGWDIYGGQIMAERSRCPGTRPLGWWWFVAGEERPRDGWSPEDYGIEAVRLAELGELTREALAALRERANEARLNIDRDEERFSGGAERQGCRLIGLRSGYGTVQAALSGEVD